MQIIRENEENVWQINGANKIKISGYLEETRVTWRQIHWLTGTKMKTECTRVGGI